MLTFVLLAGARLLLLISVLVANHTVKFEGKFTKLENAFCQYIYRNNLMSNFGSLDILGVIVIVLVCLATLILLSYLVR